MDYVSVMFVVQLVASLITAALAFDYSCYVCESSDLTSQGRSTGCPSYAACCQDPFQDAQHAVTMETSCRYCIKAKYSWKDRPDQYTNRYCYNDVNQDEEKQGPRLVNHLLGFQTQSSTEILDTFSPEFHEMLRRKIDMERRLENGECIRREESTVLGKQYVEICGCKNHLCNAATTTTTTAAAAAVVAVVTAFTTRVL